MKILIMGASGSGQTTLGKALSGHLGYQWVDTDDLYWLPTTPMYTEKRDIAQRLNMALESIRPRNVVVSGAINGWGLAFENAFDVIVFLSVDTDIRLKRLREREQRELGFVDEAFIEWASEYENPLFKSRNRVKHEYWLSQRTATVLRLTGNRTVEERLDSVLQGLTSSGVT